MSTIDEDAGPGGALLLLHGIGEQRPYEALDGFVQGLARRFGATDGSLEHRLVWRDGHADTAVRVPLAGLEGSAGEKWLDVYEYYWAADMERQISFRKVLAWTARTCLTPLRLWATNLDLLKSEDRPPPKLFYRELRRAIYLIGFGALVLGLFIWVAANQADLRHELASAWQVLVRPPPRTPASGHWFTDLPRRLAHNQFPLVLFAWAVVVVLGGALLRSVKLLWSAPRDQTALREKGFMAWRSRTLAFAAVFLGLAIGAALVPPLGIGTALQRAARIFFHSPHSVVLVIAAGLACVARRLLVQYVGDVALYTDEDERSASFATHKKILEGAVRRLRALLMDPAYASVHLAGHSLGSVIAYDAIDYLARERRARPVEDQPDTRLTEEQFDRLAGLLTFGSPLDKIEYFFRTDVQPRQSVRSQILSSLHSFRRRSTNRDFGALHLAVYNPPEPGHLLWLNVWSRGDPVSGHLEFYRTDHQVRLSYAFTLRSHLRYWDDPGFYDWVAVWLIARNPTALRLGPP